MISSNSLGDLASELHRAGVSEQSIDVAERILEDIGELNPGKDLPKAIKDWLGRQTIKSGLVNSINFIPSDRKGACHDLLMVVCAGERDFDLNTIDAIALCINCYRTMKAVIIVSGYWSEDEFNIWRKPPIKSLHEQFGITFSLVTPLGGRWTVNPIVL